ncbi:hypothetical protein KM043_005074 [Ampulex compressa]|nr:hypothetical protein KM043_005074 [Ampulex compressa]
MTSRCAGYLHKVALCLGLARSEDREAHRGGARRKRRKRNARLGALAVYSFQKEEGPSLSASVYPNIGIVRQEEGQGPTKRAPIPSLAIFLRRSVSSLQILATLRDYPFVAPGKRGRAAGSRDEMKLPGNP